MRDTAEVLMTGSSDLQTAKLPLNHGTGEMPALGFGTLLPDPAVTISATRDALETGFRHFDCAERYRNEDEVGDALQEGLAAAKIREDHSRPGRHVHRRTSRKNPAQVLLAWAAQRGTALLTTPKTAARARENFNISALPQDTFNEINRIETRQRLNQVVKTGVPGFIPQGSSQ